MFLSKVTQVQHWFKLKSLHHQIYKQLISMQCCLVLAHSTAMLDENDRKKI